ncbi:hypothetical protein FHG87_005597 [Trinorchestia longiramus]|nr:hypothetical protein FHG87_005597 [Trinorchestia longiramus]
MRSTVLPSKPASISASVNPLLQVSSPKSPIAPIEVVCPLKKYAHAMAAKQSKVPSTYFRTPSTPSVVSMLVGLPPLLLAWLAPTSTPSFVYQPIADIIAHCGTQYAFWLNAV